ncbi:17860_t:CDS:1, partial [Acaulospora morrowiae]
MSTPHTLDFNGRIKLVDYAPPNHPIVWLNMQVEKLSSNFPF